MTQAMAEAATKAGAEIRTGAAVERILVKDGAAAGLVLEGGEEISAKTVISNADPRRTFLKLIDPVHLPPGFVVKMQNFRANGTVAKINLALDRAAEFQGAAGCFDGCCAFDERSCGGAQRADSHRAEH